MQSKEVKQIDKNIEKVKDALAESLELLKTTTVGDEQTTRIATDRVQAFLTEVDEFRNLIRNGEDKGTSSMAGI